MRWPHTVLLGSGFEAGRPKNSRTPPGIHLSIRTGPVDRGPRGSESVSHRIWQSLWRQLESAYLYRSGEYQNQNLVFYLRKKFYKKKQRFRNILKITENILYFNLIYLFVLISWFKNKTGLTEIGRTTDLNASTTRCKILLFSSPSNVHADLGWLTIRFLLIFV